MRKRTVRIGYWIAASMLLVLSLLCSACTKGTWYGFITQFYFNTEATLRLYADYEEGPTRETVEALTARVEETLREIEQSISVSEPTSDVSKFNEAAPGETVPIGETAYRVFSEAMRLYRWTDGYYNPAVYHSVAAYGFYFDKAEPQTLPGAELVSALRELSERFAQIELIENDGNYFVKKPQDGVVEADGTTYVLKVDLGGIGKGYATDVVRAMIDQAGIEYGYFNFSSSSMTLKQYLPEREYYELTVAAPRGVGAYLKMNVNDTNLSTSADNGLYYVRDGVRYCQIIDPKTGMPVNVTADGKQADGIITATVLGGSAAECDALTTALMAMGKERAAEFIGERLKDRSVWFVYERAGAFEVYTNANDGQYTILNDGYRLAQETA